MWIDLMQIKNKYLYELFILVIIGIDSDIPIVYIYVEVSTDLKFDKFKQILSIIIL